MSQTGWWNPNITRPRPYHYIGEDGRSLCGRWLHLAGDLEEGRDEHKDNCKACQKKRLAMKAEKKDDDGSNDKGPTK